MAHGTADAKELGQKFAFGLEDTPAVQPACELSEEDLDAIDLAYHEKKTSGAIARERQQRAVEDQVQWFRCRGGL